MIFRISLSLSLILVLLFVFTLNAQDKKPTKNTKPPTHEDVMNMLKAFFEDPQARKEFSDKNVNAKEVEDKLMKFPPEIQKKLTDLVIKMIGDIDNTTKGKDKKDSLEAFTPEFKKEIEAIAKELEKDPEFIKSLKTDKKEPQKK